MSLDHHESFQNMINESLAGVLSAEKQRSLHQHLGVCATCQDYLNLSNRVIAGLGGFSFEVDRTANLKVLASLTLRAQQMAVAPPSRRRWGLISLAAFGLTVGGSFVDLQFGNLIASALGIQSAQIQHTLLTFWIVPSFCLVLMFPLLPVLSKAAGRRKERAL